MTVLLVVLGGAIGALLRLLVSHVVRPRHDGDLPWGTFVVNCVGSAGLGLLVGGTAPSNVATALGVGVCGAFTTFSTLSHETIRLARRGDEARVPHRPFTNVLVNLVGGLAAAVAGFAVARALWP